MSNEDRIALSHGGGGRMTQRLIKDYFQNAFDNPILNQMLDAAVFSIPSNKIAFSTDSFVVDPIFFPGGDIGKLAICGTINDLAVSGAKPYYLSVGMIIEEGFLLADLRRVVDSMAITAKEAEVMVVAGDTKVVEKGMVDKIFINTTGIGIIPEDYSLSPVNLQPGDAILVSGNLGEHGLAILAQRQGFSFATPVKSDCTVLHRLTQAILKFGPNIRCLRDPTRGGLATTLNEIAQQGGVGMLVQEELLPVTEAVSGGCGMLGLDSLYLANEGKLVAFVNSACVDEVLQVMRHLPEGRDARLIGKVVENPVGIVMLETALGARYILRMFEGEQLPRIC